MSFEQNSQIFLGANHQQNPVFLNPKYANRHGLISGATGTGKTVTLQVLAEQFSAQGIPVFLADVKGDLSGMSQPSAGQDFLVKRAELIGYKNFLAHACPVIFWDLLGERGHPVRTTISEMGPVLLARLMNLSDAQEGILTIAFRIADEQGLLLLELEDLKALLIFMGENASQLSKQYGLISTSSLNAVQRNVLVLEEQQAEIFFGEPALDIRDMMRQTMSGEGIVNILVADKLIHNPKLYSTFLLWMLSELFEELPEVGELDKPKLVFFFDEAHLLFDETPKALVEKIEQVVRLIRSKGVGIFFVTQSPSDIPEEVLSQLGNKIQHTLRAFTPKAQKDIKAAANSFRPNPNIKIEDALTQMGVGEALVSVLEGDGTPSIVDRVFIRPPETLLGPMDPQNFVTVMNRSPVAGKYDIAIDRDSAYEMLQRRAEEKLIAERELQARQDQEKLEEQQLKELEKQKKKEERDYRGSATDALVKSVVRSIGSKIGREIVRGVLGSFMR